MKRHETVKVIQLLMGIYPVMFAKLDGVQIGQMVGSWQIMLEDQDPERVNVAVKSLAARSRFCPTISEVLDELGKSQTKPASFDVDEAFKTSLMRGHYTPEQADWAIAYEKRRRVKP